MAKPLSIAFLRREPYPIRFDWLAEVGKLPGKLLRLGIALAWMAVLRGGPSVQLGRRSWRTFPCRGMLVTMG